jgi:XTP/dITP diphosphohydrolase
MRASNRVYFATSNDSKFSEARFVLRDYPLRLGRLRTKGVEPQSDSVAEVALTAAAGIAAGRNRRIFVEDTGLFVKSLGGFPGAYAAFVNRTLGPKGLLKLLLGSTDRSAEFVSAVALVGSSRSPRVFIGRLRGSISMHPVGSHGFGFDPVFVPEGGQRTLAQLTLEEKCTISHRAKALRAMGQWLVSSKSRESL